MATSFYKKIETQYYEPALLKMTRQTERFFEEQGSEIIEPYKKSLSHYFFEIAEKQANRELQDVAYINISYLFSSLYFGKPVFQLDCYGDGWMLESDSLFSDALDASWLTKYLPDFQQDIKAAIIEEKTSRFVHPEQVNVLSYRAVRSMLNYFCGIIKYRILDMIDKQVLAKITKSEKFFITFGEYLDWQKIIYAVQPDIDIFNCDAKDSLKHRTFHAVLYAQKKFDTLSLTGSIFKDCSFSASEVSKSVWNDCLFENCSFDGVCFSTSRFFGATFVNCTFCSCHFTEVLFSSRNLDISQQDELFKVTQFYRCAFLSTEFENCDLTACTLEICETEGINIIGGILTGSDFLSISINTTNSEEGGV